MRTQISAAAPAVAPERMLVVAGASVRGFASSAARAGWTVFAADLFRDLDLVAAAEAAVLSGGIGPFSAGDMTAACAGFPPAAWCYTGGLENHPDVIAAISVRHRLFGNSPAAVRAVRDVERLAAAVRDAGLLFPETRQHASEVPTDGSFLVKPAAAAGGRGIRRWQGERDTDAVPHERFWQRLVPGRSWSASYVLASPAARLLGVSRQYTGLRWCHAHPFAYCGSVDVPLARIGHGVREQLERLGRLLMEEFHLVGLVGVDLIVDAGGRLHVIEVNPRPTASMELHERATGESLAATHIAACGGPAASAAASNPPPTTWAKCVLFASSAVRVTPATIAAVSGWARPWSEEDGWPAVADIPAPPQDIAAGRPLVTLFARGREPAAAVRSLRSRTAMVQALFANGAAPPCGTDQPASRRGTATGASAPTL